MKSTQDGTVAENVARAIASAEAAGISINITLRSKDWLGSPEPAPYAMATATLESIPDRLADQLRSIAGEQGMVTISITPKGHYDLGEAPRAEPETLDGEEVRHANFTKAVEVDTDMQGRGLSDFDIGDQVALKKSGELGEIIAVAWYARRPRQLLVEYVAGDGRQVEGWFDDAALRFDPTKQDSDRPARPSR